VKLQCLPYAPSPHADETLSSWIERIGIFYGIGLAQARTLLSPTVPRLTQGTNEDLDTSPGVRRVAGIWAGCREDATPVVWSAANRRMLELSARLAYCPKCWDDDAAHGVAPYIRRAWAHWSSVSCPRHKDWLAASRPATGHGSALNGWAIVWQSNPTWAQAAGLRYEPRGQELAPAFVPGSIERPEVSWGDFELQLARLVSADGKAGRYGIPILAGVVGPQLLGLRTKVLKALQVAAAAALVSDLDLRGYSRSEPGWIAARIACLVTALELTRLASNRRPLMPRVRTIVEQSAWREWVASDLSGFVSGLREPS
jgi:hypothetical protein